MRNKELVVAYPIFDGIAEKFVLLGERQKNPWKEQFSGFGGNVEKDDEDLLQRQIIELEEEAGIIAQKTDIIKKAEFVINVKDKEPKMLHVYVVNKFSGEGKRTEEMRPEWFAFRSLPIHRMIKGDEFWVPRIFAGEYLTGTIFRDAEFNFLNIEVTPCNSSYFR